MPPVAGARGHGLIYNIGTIVCLLYAALWVVAWFFPSLTLHSLFWTALHPPTVVKYVPPIWTVLLFLAAPIMRRDARAAQIAVSVGILVTIAPGVWDALHGGVLLGDAMMWLIVPLGIAVWVIGPPLSDAERAELPPLMKDQGAMSLGQTFVAGIGSIFATIGIFGGDFVTNFGYGDIVIPRYAAITFGLCCIVGAIVAGARSMRSRKAVHRVAKPAVRVDATPQGFHSSVIIDGQTVGMGERATEREAREAAEALIARIAPDPPAP
jgi:hypothetical protein